MDTRSYRRAYRAASAVLVVLLGAPAAADAQWYAGRDPSECSADADPPTVAYTIQPGDSCARIATRVLGRRSAYRAIHEHNPDMGPTPHRLRPGTVLCLPVPRDEAEPPDESDAAQITALRQDVRRRRAEAQRWDRAELGEGLPVGSRVDVRRRAFAELTFPDDTIITLRGDTLVVLYGRGTRRLRRGGGAAQLERGSLRTRLGELRMTVQTPSAEVALDTGDAVTSVDEARVSRISVHSGRRASVRGQRGAPRSLPVGTGSSVREGEAPSEPVPLPPAPTWVEGPMHFLVVDGQSVVTGAWEPVENALSYRVELARREDGSDLAGAVEVPYDVTRFEIRGLPPGRYFARLSTLSRERFESVPSTPRPIELLAATVEPPEGVAAPGEGEAIPAGALLRLPAGVVCARPGEAPASEVALDERGTEALICRTDDAAVVPPVLAVAAAPEAPQEPAEEPPPPVEEPEPPPPPPDGDLFGAVLSPTLVGTRDLTRTGVSGWVTYDHARRPTGGQLDHDRVSVGVEGALADRTLLLGVGTSASLRGVLPRPLALQGGGDVWTMAGTSFRVGPLVLQLDLGAFWPTDPDAGGRLRAVRLAPSVHARFAADRLRFTTRQSAFVSLRGPADGLWASAYAAELQLDPVLSLALEGQLAIGQVEGASFVAPVAGLRANLALGPVLLGLGGRAALSDDARRSVGEWSVVLGLGVGAWDVGR